MSTPDTVRFSRILGTPGDVYERLVEEFFHPLYLEDPVFARLRPTDDPWYAGFEQYGEELPCKSLENLVALARHYPRFVSVHEVPEAGSIYLNVVDVDESGFSLMATVDTGMIYMEYGWLEPGQWFKNMLTTLTAALRAEVCEFGRYQTDYSALSPVDILAQLRSGELLKTWYSSYCAISTKLIHWREVEKLMARREVKRGVRELKYEESESGYHVFYVLP